MRLAGLCAAALMLGPVSAQAQAPFPPVPEIPRDPPVQILLVGVFHFAQYDTTRFDVLSPARQKEVDEFTRALVKFRPTKVMVEWQPYFRQRYIDSTYALYRKDAFALSRNEVQQLGYRLARHAALPRVWAIDHAGFWLGDSLRTIAVQMNQLDLIDGRAPFTYPNPMDLVPEDSLFRRATIGTILRWMSSEPFQRAMYDGYVNRLARVGIVAGDDFDERENEIGGELLSEWLRRNIKIYRHVLARTDYVNRDRIVLFIGSDHVMPLRQLFEANLNFKVVGLEDFF